MDRQSKRMGGNWRVYGGLAVMMSFAAGACVAGNPGGAISPFPNQTSEGTIEPAKCPPDSLAISSGSQTPQNFSYSCEGGDVGIVTVLPGKSVTFQSSCGIDAPDGCIACGLVVLYGPQGQLFSCTLQAAYLKAYGIDLAAMGFTMTDSSMPRKIYNANGDVIRMQHWAIPIINEDGKFVDWEFTTIEPHFSVVDGEVVIRDNRDRIIGGRAGITLGK